MPRTDDAITRATGVTVHWLLPVIRFTATCARLQIAVVTLLW